MKGSINKPAGMGRRVVGALIDLFIILFITMIINSYVITPIANKNFDLEIKETMLADYQEEYYTLAEEYGIATYKRDGNSFKLYFNEELETDELNALIDEFNKVPEVVNLMENYINPASKEISNMYFVMVIISISIPELLIFLVIPLLTKRSATIGQMIMKIRTVHKNDLEAKNFQIILRFVTVLAIETILLLYFFNYLALLLSPIISMIIMALNKNRNCLHDILSYTKVVKNDAIIFKNIKEKNEYLNIKEKTKNIKKTYDADMQELRDNFKFIDEQEKYINESKDEQ